MENLNILLSVIAVLILVLILRGIQARNKAVRSLQDETAKRHTETQALLSKFCDSQEETNRLLKQLIDKRDK